MSLRSFASDNNAPVAPEILEAILAANEGDATGYGADDRTARAIDRFRDSFGPQTGVYFTFNGTGANVVALSCLLRPWEAVLCPSTAHLHTDECGAFERFNGSKVVAIPTGGGKLRPEALEPYLHGLHDEHFVQPRAISISQSTEYGDAYTVDETRELCRFAHERGLLVHVDGARISNAAAALGTTPRALTADAGVDVLTFGGTKNGLMYGEAICFFGDYAENAAAPFVRKQGMQLGSKMRFIAAQFDALLAGELWLRYAGHANAMTRRLHERVLKLPAVRVTRPVRCNAIFATLPPGAAERLREHYYYYDYGEEGSEARWMTHWATTPADVDAFATALTAACSGETSSTARP